MPRVNEIYLDIGESAMSYMYKVKKKTQAPDEEVSEKKQPTKPTTKPSKEEQEKEGFKQKYNKHKKSITAGKPASGITTKPPTSEIISDVFVPEITEPSTKPKTSTKKSTSKTSKSTKPKTGSAAGKPARGVTTKPPEIVNEAFLPTPKEPTEEEQAGEMFDTSQTPSKPSTKDKMKEEYERQLREKYGPLAWFYQVKDVKAVRSTTPPPIPDVFVEGDVVGTVWDPRTGKVSVTSVGTKEVTPEEVTETIIEEAKKSGFKDVKIKDIQRVGDEYLAILEGEKTVVGEEVVPGIVTISKEEALKIAEEYTKEKGWDITKIYLEDGEWKFEFKGDGQTYVGTLPSEYRLTKEDIEQGIMKSGDVSRILDIEQTEEGWKVLYEYTGPVEVEAEVPSVVRFGQITEFRSPTVYVPIIEPRFKPSDILQAYDSQKLKQLLDGGDESLIAPIEGGIEPRQIYIEDEGGLWGAPTPPEKIDFEKGEKSQAIMNIIGAGTELSPITQPWEVLEREIEKMPKTSFDYFAESVFESSPWGILTPEEAPKVSYSPEHKLAILAGKALGEASDIAFWTFAGLGAGKALGYSRKALKGMKWLGGPSKAAQAVRGTMRGLLIGGEAGKAYLMYERGYSPEEIAIDIVGDIGSIYGFEKAFASAVEPKLTRMEIEKALHEQGEHIVYGRGGQMESIGFGVKGKGEEGWKPAFYIRKTKTIPTSAVDKPRSWIIEENIPIAGGKGRMSWYGRVKMFLTSGKAEMIGYSPEKPFITKELGTGTVMGGGVAYPYQETIPVMEEMVSPAASLAGASQSAMIQTIKSIGWISLPSFAMGTVTMLDELAELRGEKPSVISTEEPTSVFKRIQIITPEYTVGHKVVTPEYKPELMTEYKPELMVELKPELKVVQEMDVLKELKVTPTVQLQEQLQELDIARMELQGVTPELDIEVVPELRTSQIYKPELKTELRPRMELKPEIDVEIIPELAVEMDIIPKAIPKIQMTMGDVDIIPPTPPFFPPRGKTEQMFDVDVLGGWMRELRWGEIELGVEEWLGGSKSKRKRKQTSRKRKPSKKKPRSSKSKSKKAKKHSKPKKSKKRKRTKKKGGDMSEFERWIL